MNGNETWSPVAIRIRRTLVQPSLKVALATLKTILLAWRTTCNENVLWRHWSIPISNLIDREDKEFRQNGYCRNALFEDQVSRAVNLTYLLTWTSWKARSFLRFQKIIKFQFFSIFFLRSDLIMREKHFLAKAKAIFPEDLSSIFKPFQKFPNHCWIDVYRRWKFDTKNTFRSSTSSTDPSIVGVYP